MSKGEPYPAVIAERGDTLMVIAMRELGSAASWPTLARLNNWTSDECRRFQPGDLIVTGGLRPIPDALASRRFDGDSPWG